MKKVFGLVVLSVVLAGCTALSPYPRLKEAIRAHRMDDAQTLLNAHPRQVSASDALIVAAGVGDLAAAAHFFAQGALTNIRNTEGETALTLAARSGQIEMVEYLVNHGADPNYRDGRGLSALQCATSWNPWDFVIVDQKKVIAQYLVEVSSSKRPSTTQIVRALAESRSYIWGGPVEPGGKAYVVDLQVPFVR
jgi:Ankyrin repeats (many copies)